MTIPLGNSFCPLPSSSSVGNISPDQRRSWNCCDQRTHFIVIWKHFRFILSTGTKIRIDSVIRPRSSSRGRNTSASVTVTDSYQCLMSYIHRILSFPWYHLPFEVSCNTISASCPYFYIQYDAICRDFKFTQKLTGIRLCLTHRANKSRGCARQK